VLAFAPLLTALVEASSFSATFDIFSPSVVPSNVRAVLALALVSMLFARRPLAAPDQAALTGDLTTAALIGAACGLSASVVAAAARLAGSLIDNALAAGLFGQGLFAGGGPVSRIYSWAFALTFLSTGAYPRLVRALVDATGAMHDVHPALAAAALARTFLLAGLELAGPVLFVQMLAALLSGALGRVAPYANAMLFSGPLSAALTLACLVLGGSVVWPAFAALSQRVVEQSTTLVR
jgi:flagellar biosynthesis protein FliR